MLYRPAYVHDNDASLESVHNYYEHFVFNLVFRLVGEEERADIDFIADVACVALNHLPPRYVRHDVDMAFYLSPREQEEIEQKVRDAVENALSFVRSRLQAERERDAAEAEAAAALAAARATTSE